MASTHCTNTLAPISHLEVDSLVIRDGLPAMQRGAMASTADGRIVFSLGNLRANDQDAAANAFENGLGQTPDQYAIADLDAIDLLLSTRTRFRVGPLFAFGTATRFYALDKNTVVICDYNEREDTIRQRLVKIDWSKKTAECPFYRSYAAILDTFLIKFLVGDEWGIVTDDSDLLVFPTNPLNPARIRNITNMKDKAIENSSHLYRQGTVDPDAVDLVPVPFFISNTVLGFFLQYDNSIDLAMALVLDLTNGSFYLQPILPAPIFLLSNNLPSAVSAPIDQANNGEYFISVQHEGYHAVHARLNTRTLEWSDVKLAPNEVVKVTCRGGTHLVVATCTPAKGAIRVISGASKDDGTGCRLRLSLLRHPLRVDSLVRLSTIALQRSGRVSPIQLRQIADRIG